MYLAVIGRDLISGIGKSKADSGSGLSSPFHPQWVASGMGWGAAGKIAIGLDAIWESGKQGFHEVQTDWRGSEAGDISMAAPFMGSETGSIEAAPVWRNSDTGALILQGGWLAGPKGAAEARTAWIDAERLWNRFGFTWIGSPRGHASKDMEWRESQAAQFTDRLPWGIGRIMASPVNLLWRKAGLAPWYIKIVRHPGGGGGSQGSHGGRDQNGSWTIYLKPTYHMLHDVSLVRLPERTPIPASSFRFQKTADNPHIQFNAVIHGRAALDSVIPSGPDPIEVEASINGRVVRIVLDPPKASEKFGGNAYNISGRSLSWYLGMPFQKPRNKTSSDNSTAQALAGEELPVGWTLSWTGGDWEIPAKAFSYRNMTPLQAIQRLAAAARHVISPSHTDKALTVRPRYPVLPWDYASATPNLIIPSEAALSMPAKAYDLPTYANAVYVAGGAVGGVLGYVWKTGTAADRPLSQIQDDLITDSQAAYLRGVAELAGQWQQPIIRSIQVPMDGDGFPLADSGWLVRVDDPHDGAVFGIVTGVEWGMDIKPAPGGKADCDVWQTLSLGDDSGDLLAVYRELIPDDPLIYGVVQTVDGLSLGVNIFGGTLQARGQAEVGDHVYIRAGRIDSLAPNLPYYDMGA